MERSALAAVRVVVACKCVMGGEAARAWALRSRGLVRAPGALCWSRRDTRGKRGYDGSMCAGVAELARAGVAELARAGVAGEVWDGGGDGARLGAGRGEIPAASAGMTELILRGCGGSCSRGGGGSSVGWRGRRCCAWCGASGLFLLAGVARKLGPARGWRNQGAGPVLVTARYPRQARV